MNFKKILFDERLERYLIFNVTNEKKLFNIIKELAEIFPKKKWKDLKENRAEKEIEILEKFRKKGKFYKKICTSWLLNNKNLIEAFNNHFKEQSQEITANEVLDFFKQLKEKFNLNTKDIVIFIHIYLEQVLGMSLFEESALSIEKEL